MLSNPQLRKIKMGGAIMIKPHQFDDSSEYRIMVAPNSARRIATALRKQKGLRLALKPEEDLMQMTEGGAISLKKLGQDIKKGFNKKIVTSGLGKDIASGLIRTSTGVLLPAAGTALAMALGDPTGMSGGIPAQIAGQELQQYAERKGYGLKDYGRRLAGPMKKTMGMGYKGMKTMPMSKSAAEKAIAGKGVYKTLAKIGIKKKDAQKVARDVGKTAVRTAAKAASTALTAYTGNPKLGAALEEVAVAGGDKLIDSGSGRKAIAASSKVAKRVAVEAIDDYVDKNLSGVERDVAQKALAGKYPSAADLVYDYGTSKIEDLEMPMRIGSGVRKTRLGLRVGGRIGYRTLSMPMMEGGAISGMKTAGTDFRKVRAPSAPSNIIQLGSPYARIDSAQMSPFIGASPQLAPGILVGKSGQGIYPAGSRSGKGFNPA